MSMHYAQKEALLRVESLHRRNETQRMRNESTLRRNDELLRRNYARLHRNCRWLGRWNPFRGVLARDQADLEEATAALERADRKLRDAHECLLREDATLVARIANIKGEQS